MKNSKELEKTKYKKSKTSIMLMEIIISILIFIAGGAICIQLFVRAHIVSEDAKVLDKAVMLLSSEAEQFKAGDINFETKTIYYSTDLIECAIENAAYRYTMDVEEAGEVAVVYTLLQKFEKVSDDSIVYELSTKRCAIGDN